MQVIAPPESAPRARNLGDYPTLAELAAEDRAAQLYGERSIAQMMGWMSANPGAVSTARRLGVDPASALRLAMSHGERRDSEQFALAWVAVVGDPRDAEKIKAAADATATLAATLAVRGVSPRKVERLLLLQARTIKQGAEAIGQPENGALVARYIAQAAKAARRAVATIQHASIPDTPQPQDAQVPTVSVPPVAFVPLSQPRQRETAGGPRRASTSARSRSSSRSDDSGSGEPPGPGDGSDEHSAQLPHGVERATTSPLRVGRWRPTGPAWRCAIPCCGRRSEPDSALGLCWTCRWRYFTANVFRTAAEAKAVPS